MPSGDDQSLPFLGRTVGRPDKTIFSALEDSLKHLYLPSHDTGDRNADDGNYDDFERTGPLGLNQLNSPPEALVELVFVHGLGGGSRKSWSFTKHENHFWPKSWLSRDPVFHNVRIHSFGYRSAKTQVIPTINGIPEFADSLLTALWDSPLVRSTQNPIILIGHSMGGLAFIKAHTIEPFKDIAIRIRSLFFMGTPHAGSEFTRTITRLLKFFPFINATESLSDLEPTSRMLESLNESFPGLIKDIAVRSFSEELDVIVPRQSAYLYCVGEVRYSLHADHRGMCKYDRPTDPNFIVVRNALAATVDDLLQHHMSPAKVGTTETLRLLGDFLGILEPPQDDFEDHYQSSLSDDTCSWFISGSTYREWRHPGQDPTTGIAVVPNVMLIEADPGAGKSVLAAQVINNLQTLSYGCSYYFFDSQDRQKSKSSCLIRSLAFQMALLSPGVREALLDLHKQAFTILSDNDKSLWRKLFTNCLFRRPFDRPHYWVIDGLDECQQAASIMQMFSTIDPSTHLKVMMTTRPQESINRELLRYKDNVTRVHISKADTLLSMRDYVKERTSRLRLHREDDMVDLVDSILNNAEGSFLWVKLVLDEVTKATGPQQIKNSIESIPKGMNQLYADILQSLEIEISPEERPAAKAFLSWTLCANPPLTVSELEGALRLEKLDKFVHSMCNNLRNLIVIDHSNKVRAVHKTARTFLLTATIESDFVVSAADAHKRMSSLLVEHLRARLHGIQGADHLRHWRETRAGLDDYALLYFSDHIRRTLDHDDRSPLQDHNLFLRVAQLFKDCGLTWVAGVASTGSLDPLVKTSQNLRRWLEVRTRSTPPLGDLAEKTKALQQWSVDLVRLVAKFGRHLLEFPGSMYTLIPLFVPVESALIQNTIRQARHVKHTSITGLRNEKWDDRLCSMFYHGTTCKAVASGKHSFAVGLRNGVIHIYDNATLQMLKTINHKAMIKFMKYDDTGSLLVSVGFRGLKLWTIPDGTDPVWVADVREALLAVDFIEDNQCLISVSSQHKLVKRDARTGAVTAVISRRSNLETEEAEDTRALFRRELHYAEFSAQAGMLATMHRERSIQLTDLEDRFDIGIADLAQGEHGDYRRLEQPITAMTFCANIDVALLAVAYRDGTLASFDRDLYLIAKRADGTAFSLLTGSPDGLVLAAATVEGVITLFDIDELIPLHVLKTSTIENIRSLVFTGDGKHIIDIRDKQANLWAPAAMANRVKADTDSISESTLAPTVATSTWSGKKDEVVDITAVLPIPNSDLFVCGREDGSISVHSTRKSKELHDAYEAAGRQWIGKLAWRSKNHVLAFLCGTSTVIVLALAPDFSVKKELLKHTFLQPVIQLLLSDTSDIVRLVVVTTKTMDLWIAECPLTDQSLLVESKVQPFKNDGLFLEDVTDSIDSSQYLTLMHPDGVQDHSWGDLEAVGPRRHMLISQRTAQDEAGIIKKNQGKVIAIDRASRVSKQSQHVLIRAVSTPDDVASLPLLASKPAQLFDRRRWVLDLKRSSSELSLEPLETPGLNGVALHANLLPVSHLIEHIIGLKNQGKLLIFLSKALWVCSYELTPPYGPGKARRPSTDQRVVEYTRHLFIPDDWIRSNYSNSTSELLFVLGGAAGDCLIFIKGHEIAIIREPLSNAQKVRVE